jgi:hypothetical protein
VVATGGNRSQIASTRKRLKQGKTVAAGCDRLPHEAHGKGRVDSTSLLLKRGSLYWLRKKRQVPRTRGPTGLDRATLPDAMRTVKSGARSGAPPANALRSNIIY